MNMIPNNYEYAEALKYERTEYAKKIRKDYEKGIIKERRCNMRKIIPRTDGITNTITTVQKDNHIIVAMRGRGEIRKTHQQLEPRFDGLTNTITSVSKDNLVLEKNQIK